MALVDYSDSESDNEGPSGKQAPKVAPTARPAFQRAAPGKIKVDLPSFKQEPSQAENGATEGPPAKRARTGGAFTGFNSLLPAPKRTMQSAPKAGVSLKTSSEAAFSRNPRPKPVDEHEYDGAQLIGSGAGEEKKETALSEEPKLVGKATRFLPLSVSNKKKKKVIAKPPPVPEPVKSNEQYANIERAVKEKIAKDTEAIAKAKRPLFSILQEEAVPTPTEASKGAYEPMMAHEEGIHFPEQVEQPSSAYQSAAQTSSSSLEATVAELNLTPAQRRQLFGRSGGKDAHVMHFNLDNEYAANEQARQAGEVVEHRAVKAIAPGKHSLQQLVNNARTQQDAMEDKWAEGRRNRGEGGSKYGWS